ncbi:hypothetical protein AKJ37_04675 [candidate division MSBL1 archaeon SCGC-AAA259I09]|uniref:Metallo-beta-lactamase domain-containing protein n=1 Tax=candidate division MSBL1 archaeon SCGC-AAA259I09 TaxID=1698267 RepID=A0A133URC1_9EURY|nr:hypothetical protein AKJ37_04675 [candidate division MSBL1 archaeon SCGC-AAA259I09]
MEIKEIEEKVEMMTAPFAEFADITVEEKLAFLWFNQYSGFCIRSGDATVVVDPVEVEVEEIAASSPDLALISHEHFDHFDGEIVEGLEDVCEIATNKTVADELDFEPWVLTPGDSLKQEGVKVTVLKSEHPGEEPLTILLEFGERNVYHAIDSKPHEGMEGLNPDVLIVPIGIAPGVSARTGIEITRLAKPKVVIPHHSKQGFEEFASGVRDARVVKPERGEIFTCEV